MQQAYHKDDLRMAREHGTSEEHERYLLLRFTKLRHFVELTPEQASERQHHRFVWNSVNLFALPHPCFAQSVTWCTQEMDELQRLIDVERSWPSSNHNARPDPLLPDPGEQFVQVLLQGNDWLPLEMDRWRRVLGWN